MEQLVSKIESVSTLEELEIVRVELFGKKGFFASKFAELKNIPPQEKKEFAANLNKNKKLFENQLQEKKELLEKELLEKELKEDKIDVTRFEFIQSNKVLFILWLIQWIKLQIFSKFKLLVSEDGPLN